MNKKIFLSWLLMAILSLPVFAQIQEPVKFKTEWKSVSANEVEIVFTGKMEKGWHVYSTELPDGGPVSATFNVDNLEGAELVGRLKPAGKEIDKMDPIFGMQVRFFEGTATFVQKLKLKGGKYEVSGYLQYGACNDENCLPPTNVDFSFKGEVAGGQAAASATAEAETSDTADSDSLTLTPLQIGTNSNNVETSDYWKPVIEELKTFGGNVNNESRSWLYIFLLVS